MVPSAIATIYYLLCCESARGTRSAVVAEVGVLSIVIYRKDDRADMLVNIDFSFDFTRFDYVK